MTSASESLPWSAEAEQALLGCLLLDNSLVYRLRGKGYASMADAQGAVPGLDTIEAQNARRNQVLRSQGRGMQAMAEEQAAMDMKKRRAEYLKEIEAEGLMDFVKGNFVSSPSVADIQAGKSKLFDLAGVDVFNKVGKAQIPDGSRGEWITLDLGNGRVIPDFRVVGADGKLVSPMTGRNIEAIYGMSSKEREALADNRFETGKRLAFMGQQQVETRRHNLAMEGTSGGQERLPKVEEIRLNGIQKRLSEINEELSFGAVKKGSGEAQALILERAQLTDQQRKIFARYTSDRSEAVGPIPELNAKRSGSNRGPLTGDGKVYEAPAVMEDRQRSAGYTTLQSKYGGDIARAQVAVKQLHSAVKAASTPEEKSARTVDLQAAIYAVEAGKQMASQNAAAAMAGIVAQPRASMDQAAKPVATVSGANRGKGSTLPPEKLRRVQAERDPQVINMRSAIEKENYGRAKMVLESRLQRYLSDNYGL